MIPEIGPEVHKLLSLQDFLPFEKDALSRMGDLFSGIFSCVWARISDMFLEVNLIKYTGSPARLLLLSGSYWKRLLFYT